MCDIETIDSELQLVAALRRAARERGGPLEELTQVGAKLQDGSGTASGAKHL
jgi:hypothetical protein